MKRLALISVFAVLAGVASASIGGVATAGPVSGLVHRRADSFFSTNWAGYAASQTTFTDVKGAWTQPTADCSSVRAHWVTIAAFWVGLDGYKSRTVEQTGTEADCIGTEEFYFAWYEFYPAGLVVLDQTNYPVSPGDSINAEVSQDGSSVTVMIHNSSEGWTFSTDTSASGLAFNSAEWIAEAPSHRLTDFGAVDFSSASASDGNVTDGVISDFTYDDITLVNHPGNATVRADPSDLGSGNDNFTVTWLHS